jgi:hypothetical protein
MKPSIPNIPPSAVNSDRRQFDSAVKETLEVLTGKRGVRIEALQSTASLADVIAKVNEIIDRLQ